MSDNINGHLESARDDFADDKEILRLRKQATEYKEMIDESIGAVRSAFGFSKCNVNDPGLFVMFSNLMNGEVVEAFGGSDGQRSIFLFVVEYTSSYPTAKSQNTGSDIYLFGQFGLGKAYPRTYICKETIREKLMDLLTRKETDFPGHRNFSRRFHLLTEDPEKLRELVRFSPLDDLTHFPDLELEIQGDQCFYRTSTLPLSRKEAMKHVELTKLLLRIFQ